MNKKVLVIDDDPDIGLLLKRFLTKNNFDVEIAHNGRRGLEQLDSFLPHLVMTDFKLGDMDGGQLLNKIKEKHPGIPVIIITGYSDIKVAVDVIKQGAFDYVTKPLFPDEILVTIKKAIETPVITQQIANETTYTENTTRKTTPASGKGYIFGNSAESKNLLKQIDLVAPTNFSVIIYGESGSGKEAIAQEIHKRSKRKDKPFIAMDCGAISKDLAGSELFGHEKGSFTGALNQKIGHFELANGGTLFLDEVANLSYETQVALLRVVQERKLKRIGGTKEISLDVRIIVASNEQLREASKKGKFREDLFHRFNEFNLDVPPLRERKDDIITFAEYFLEQTNEELGKSVKRLSDEVIQNFMAYPWYGNLRELKNVIKRATLMADKDVIDTKCLPFEIVNHDKLLFLEDNNHTTNIPETDFPSNKPNLKSAAAEAEYEMILKVLKQVNFNKSKAARLLHIDRKTLYNKMKSYNLE
jgi:two-component system response regulator HydG